MNQFEPRYLKKCEELESSRELTEIEHLALIASKDMYKAIYKGKCSVCINSLANKPYGLVGICKFCDPYTTTKFIWRYEHRVLKLLEGDLDMMIRKERNITEDQYNRAIENNRYLTGDDEVNIFTPEERYGYGIYDSIVYKREDGTCYVSYYTSNTCD